MDKYADVKRQRPAHEANDCAVIALALVTGQEYSLVHAMLQQYGRKDGKGTQRNAQNEVLKCLGFHYVVHKPLQPNGHRYSPSTVKHWVNPKKKYLAYVAGRVLAIVDGVVQDWTHGGRHRIRQIVEVAPVGEPLAAKVVDSLANVPLPKPGTVQARIEALAEENDLYYWSREEAIVFLEDAGINRNSAAKGFGIWMRKAGYR